MTRRPRPVRVEVRPCEPETQNDRTDQAVAVIMRWLERAADDAGLELVPVDQSSDASSSPK